VLGVDAVDDGVFAMKIDRDAALHLIERDTSLKTGWQHADPVLRRNWHQARARLEFRHSNSSPDGHYRSYGNLILHPAIAMARWGLRITRLKEHYRALAHDIRLIDLEIVRPDLPAGLDGYRILHITDPHFDDAHGLARHIVDLVMGAPDDRSLDLCVITGDLRVRSRGPFIETGILRDLEILLKGLACRDGFLLTLGNHDTHEMVAPVEAMGLRVLTNECAVVRRDGAVLFIVGLDDVHRHYTDEAKAVLSRFKAAEDRFGLALVHSPEFAGEAAQAGIGLYLCGHTHGGQIRPFSDRPLVRHLRRHHDLVQGAWRISDMDGYTSPGAGTSGLPLRVRCPGEVTMITLRKGQGQHKPSR